MARPRAGMRTKARVPDAEKFHCYQCGARPMVNLVLYLGKYTRPECMYAIAMYDAAHQVLAK